MVLPKLKKCCWYMSLRNGCLLLATLSSLFCVADIVAGAWNLPHYEMPEDNFIGMSMVMFSTLSLISNVVILLGILMKRPGYLQLSLLFNSVFILCIFLVAVVTCLFSPLFVPRLKDPATVVLVVLGLNAGALYSVYYMMVVNSTYRQMKLSSESAIPV
ncbi:uncharacterized protein [Choristoneura fumiferana]